MITSSALPEDAQAIHDLALINNKDRDDWKETGFLELPVKKVSVYEQIIKDNQPVIVVRNMEQKVTAYCLGYESDYFVKHHKNDSKLDQLISEKVLEPYVYLEELAVSDEHKGKGQGINLLVEIINEGVKRGYTKFVGITAHYPVQHITMIKMLEGLGFKCSEEIEDGTGLRFGLYIKQKINT